MEWDKIKEKRDLFDHRCEEAQNMGSEDGGIVGKPGDLN